MKPVRGLALPLLAVGLLAGACTVGSAAGGPGGSGSSSVAATDNPEQASLTYWYWGESDAPGANDWMKGRIADYEKAHPGVKITFVPQPTDTLTGAFSAAAQAQSGPDIATQWVTLPVLSAAWAGHVTPISSLLSKDQMKTWINADENSFGGQVWGMPTYLVGFPFAINKSLFAAAGLEPTVPKTWADLLSACHALRAKGITPIGAGNKDGYFGGWFFSNIGKQKLDSLSELKQAITGASDFSDPKFSGFYAALAELRDSKCFNNDISSLTLDQGMQLFGQSKAAMSFASDGNVATWAKSLGESTIDVGNYPKWGNGKLAESYNATQSSTAFVTSWSQHKKAAAQFLSWLHEPDNMAKWYQATGIFPADTSFTAAQIASPLAKKRWALIKDAQGQVFAEDYLPPAVDQNGDLPAGQVITSGGTPEAAVKTWTAALNQWRAQSPDELKHFKDWAGK